MSDPKIWITNSSGGEIGPQGPSGPEGPQGIKGEDGLGFNFRGEWVTDTLYIKNDVVTQNGSSYIANYDYQSSYGPSQDGDLWSPIALKGVDGAPGLDGADGADGAPGLDGADGADGIGMPVGGEAGQILAKDTATDYDFIWIDNYANWTSQLKHEVKLSGAIAKGQAVYVSSADGTNIVVSKASNATEATSSKTLGLLESGGSNNAKVKVITEGLLSGLNTNSANAGDPVWLGTDGNLIYGLTNKPKAPNHLVFIGIVTRANQNNGEIFVKPQNGFELNELHDLVLTNLSDQNAIIWDAISSKWINKNLSETYVTLDNLGNSLGDYVPVGDVGNPDGVASLDSTGNVPVTQLGNLIAGASWNYIGSTSSTSGSSVAFNNLNGQYKELLLTFHYVGSSTNDLVQFRINGDSNSSSYDMTSLYSYGASSYYGHPIFNNAMPTLIAFDSSSGHMRIVNANSTSQKGVSLSFRGRVSNQITSSYVGNAIETLAGAYVGSSAVNSISVSLSGGSYYSGTWKLWGLK